jgi:hypothetical protein
LHVDWPGFIELPVGFIVASWKNTFRRGHGYDKERTDQIMRTDRTLLNLSGQGK